MAKEQTASLLQLCVEIELDSIIIVEIGKCLNLPLFSKDYTTSERISTGLACLHFNVDMICYQ